jgi:Fe-S cluster biogenesis protein NfuA
MKRKYIQTDTLQEQLDWDNLMKMPRYAGGHDKQMQGLFKNAKVIGHWNEGDWSGEVATCVQLEDKRFAIYNDYYGSCSGCDSWESATDKTVKAMCISLANSAYVFESLEDVIEFLSSEDKKGEWNSWSNSKMNLLSSIKK